MKYLYINFFFSIISFSLFSCNQASSSKADNNLAPIMGIENSGMLYKGLMTQDGSILMCGVKKNSNSDEKDALLVKVNQNVVAWSKLVGTNGIEEGFNFITTNISGKILALGYQKGEANNTLLINMLDTDGKMLWSTSSINCNGLENPQGAILNDGSVVVAARNAHPDPFNTNKINLLKLDANGNLVWSKQIESIVGVVKMINANNVIKLVCKQKGVFLEYSTSEKFHNFPLITLTEDGEVFSSTNILTPKAPSSSVEFYDALETSSGDLVMAGYTFNDLSPNKAFSLLCFDVNGVKKWAKRFDFPQESMAKTIDFDGSSNILVWGDGYGKGDQFYFTKVDISNGNLVKASSVKMNNTKQVRSLISKGDNYWLCFDNTNQFAWEGTNKNGSLAVEQTTEKPQIIDIQCKTKESNVKSTPNDYLLYPTKFESVNVESTIKKL